MTITTFDSFTRPANVTQYASGDLIANSATAGNVVPLQFNTAALGMGSGTARAALVFKDDEALTAAVFNVHLFSASPTVNNGDNGAFSPTTMANWLGFIPVDLSLDGRASATDAAGRGVFTVAIIFDLKHINNSERRLYGLLEAGGTYTPASGETFKVTLEITNTI